MKNYTLTTDLIADCMALIPQNLERLNEGITIETLQKEEFYTRILFFYDKEKQKIIVLLGTYYYYFKQLNSPDKFMILSHCLRTIPEFQVENTKFKKYIKMVEEMIVFDSAYERRVKDFTKIYMPTIWQATLFGDGTFPQTLQELCESYKNVMKNK